MTQVKGISLACLGPAPLMVVTQL